eukprot:scaffold6931_cov119-Isochrysis_galbana.AAC.4
MARDVVDMRLAGVSDKEFTRGRHKGMKPRRPRFNVCAAPVRCASCRRGTSLRPRSTAWRRVAGNIEGVNA